jgi:hypothetical protein
VLACLLNITTAMAAKKHLAKIVGKDRTIEQATRSEKRAASLGLHSFRHANATAMDSLGIPQQIRKQRLGPQWKQRD